MKTIKAKLKIKRGGATTIEIPADEEIERIAREWHREGKPCLETILGWQVIYRPRDETRTMTLTEVNAFTGACGKKSSPREMKIPAEFTFGYDADWKVVLTWLNGNDEPPKWSRYEEKLIRVNEEEQNLNF